MKTEFQKLIYKNLFIKNKVGVSDAQTKIFQGRAGFMELGHFDKHFVKNKRKKRPLREKFGVFLCWLVLKLKALLKI